MIKDPYIRQSKSETHGQYEIKLATCVNLRKHICRSILTDKSAILEFKTVISNNWSVTDGKKPDEICILSGFPATHVSKDGGHINICI